MGSLRLCMAAMVGRVTFLRVVVEAPRGEWEECRMLGCVCLCRACWTLGRMHGRFRHLFATAQARESVAAVRVVGFVALSKARDMFALMVGVWMDYARSIVVVSKRGKEELARLGMTAT